MMTQTKPPTHLIRVNRSNPDMPLDWAIGYEGLKFNCYFNGAEWVYEELNGMWFLRPEQVTECGAAHEVDFIDGEIYCKTCNETENMVGLRPRDIQKELRDFILLHGTPFNWDFEEWVLRQERRFHKTGDPDASKTGLIVTATQLPDGPVVVTDNEGGRYVRQ